MVNFKLVMVKRNFTKPSVKLGVNIRRLNEDVLAHQTLHAHVNLSLGRPPDSSGKRRPGQTRCRWIEQIRKDNDMPPADVWRRAVRRGHGASLRPRLATC